MKTNRYTYILLLSAGVITIACSTKKDSFVNRNFHAVNTEYNVLYNGGLALDAGIKELKTTYAENYWEVLPVERMQTPVEEMAPTEKRNANFERAEDKATKAIQKHSMYIGGTERNPQIDEAHLLLGQARYYDNRFVPALEAFNYVLLKYPSSSKIDEVKVWREKSNIRLDNDGVAIKNLKKLIEEKEGKMDEQIYSDANAMLGQAYIKEGYQDSAVSALMKAAQYSKDNEKKARYYFISGQLFSRLNINDSAFSYYQKVIDMKRKSPRVYTIQAHAMQAGQFDYKTGDTLAFMEKYRDLLKDRENREFLDVINHQVGLFYDKQGMNKKAVEYYNYSLRKKKGDHYLVASNYRNIAEINFEDAKYVMAGKYYDSTLVNMDYRTREYKTIKKKRDNLEDVIKYEGIAQRNDSILKVAGMPDAERLAYYQDHIIKLKEQEEIMRKKAEAEAQRKENMEAADGGPGPIGDLGKVSMGAPTSSKVGGEPVGAMSGMPARRNAANGGGARPGAEGTFYFYTPASVQYGKLTFQSQWGKRANADNWRVASEIKAGAGTNAQDTTIDNDSLTASGSKEDKLLEPKYDPQFYISQIPTEAKALDSIGTERNFAYYQLGVIYKEKFKEYRRAVDKLETLLTNNPEERLILPSKYNLYKLYEALGDTANAEKYKQMVLNQYPDSRYAEIIRNPNSDTVKQGTPDAVYTSVFDKYSNGEIREVDVAIDEYIDQYNGEEILPKFELLKARVQARLAGVDEYKKALNYVALTYPNSSEGKEADALLKKDIPALEKAAFGAKPTTYKLIFKVNPDDPKAAALTAKIKQFIKDGNNNRITLSNDIYTRGENFLVIHGLINRLAAVDAATILKDYKDYKVAETPVIISSEDYKVLQMKKNFDQYLAIQ
ncbi:tetratricopeptide repeat protein [Flavobacterium sp. RHBU_24]|uniref:type IX secretion system periplasmic lipoprotein PorW/SprE n=1 Tax=Flavobacterium sp. RHBU_24 TaxID=3391185 RepID=UPI003984E23B